MEFKVYSTIVDLTTDLDLDSRDVEFLFDYVIMFDKVLFNPRTNVIIIDTPILSYKQDVEHKGKTYKIRLKDETIPRIKSKRAKTKARL